MKPARFLVVSAALLMAACSPSPESVVRDLYRHIDNGDADKVAELIDPEVRILLGGKLDAGIAYAINVYDNCGGMDSLDLKLIMDGDSRKGYEANIKFRDSECENKKETVLVVKIDGKWYVRF